MSGEQTLEDHWSLGAVTRTDGKSTFKLGRALSDTERLRIPLAMGHLRDFSGEALVGPLTSALTTLLETLEEFPDVALSGRNGGQFRARLNGHMSAALTAFTGLRAAVQQHARHLDLPLGGSASAEFSNLYDDHPSYRFVWMLRNLDQHRPPASSALSFSKDEDPTTGEPRSRTTIDVVAVAQRCAAESTAASHRKQWEECGALWEGQTEPVDARTLFRAAYDACFQVVARHVGEAESVILDDAVYIARLISEIEPWGAAKVIGIVGVDPADPEDFNLRILDLNLHSLSEALETLERSRHILGQPNLRAARVLPDDFPFLGNSIGSTPSPFRTVPASPSDGI